MQGEDLVLLLVCLHAQVGQVLLDLAGHERVLVQLLGVEQRAAANALLVGAALHVQHVGVGAALAEGPGGGGREGGTLDLSLSSLVWIGLLWQHYVTYNGYASRAFQMRI